MCETAVFKQQTARCAAGEMYLEFVSLKQTTGRERRVYKTLT